MREYEIEPEQHGFAMASSRNLRVEDAEQSKSMLLAALENKTGVTRDIVAFNAGAALYAANVAATIDDGIARARATIASGAALVKLDEFVTATQELTHAA